MQSAAECSFECHFMRETPAGNLNETWHQVVRHVDKPDCRTPFYFLASLFRILRGEGEITSLTFSSDYMGGIESAFVVEGPGARLLMRYTQHINDSWQSVERTAYEASFDSNGPEKLFWDLWLNGSGALDFKVFNVDGESVFKIAGLALECFEQVAPLGTAAREAVERLSKLKAAGPEHVAPQQPEPKNGIERLAAALDEKRDPYLEWHDGPDFSSVSRALSFLISEERDAAVSLVVERLVRGYDFYAAYAAVELGKDPASRDALRAALDRLFEKRLDAAARCHLAHDALLLGPSAAAVEAFRDVIAHGAGWSEKVEALVYLKSVCQKLADPERRAAVLAPAVLEAVFAAVQADDYLVRYHAANLLFLAAGKIGEVSGDKELFGLICGKAGAQNRTPDAADREGFRRAAERLKKLF